MSATKETPLQAYVTTLDRSPVLVVRQPGVCRHIWPIDAGDVDFLNAICDRINGIGTPAAATLDLTPRPAKPSWGQIAGWVWLGFWLGLLAEFVAKTVMR